jgi:translation initiation factor 2 beta subunit (eIF-2beta)/eIF-5
VTKWVLVCEVCGNERILDVGYNLREFRRVYIYCRRCGENRAHKVVGTLEERGGAAAPPGSAKA